MKTFWEIKLKPGDCDEGTCKYFTTSFEKPKQDVRERFTKHATALCRARGIIYGPHDRFGFYCRDRQGDKMIVTRQSDLFVAHNQTGTRNGHKRCLTVQFDHKRIQIEGGEENAKATSGAAVTAPAELPAAAAAAAHRTEAPPGFEGPANRTATTSDVDCSWLTLSGREERAAAVETVLRDFPHFAAYRDDASGREVLAFSRTPLEHSLALSADLERTRFHLSTTLNGNRDPGRNPKQQREPQQPQRGRTLFGGLEQGPPISSDEEDQGASDALALTNDNFSLLSFT